MLQAYIEDNIWRGEPFLFGQVVTSQFGEPRSNNVGYHTGIDICPIDGQPGQPLGFSSQGAFILWCGVYGGTRARDVNGGYGNVLLLRLSNQYQVLLAHMQRFSDPIQQWIDSGFAAHLKPTFAPGEVLGYQGNTGYVYGTLPDGSFGQPADDDMVSGTHTHLEVRTPSGNLVNPRSVLLGADAGRDSNGLLQLAS